MALKHEFRHRFPHKFNGNIEQKHCYQCDEYKDLNEFTKNKDLSDGLSSYCRECQRYNRNNKVHNKKKTRVPHKMLNGIEHKYCRLCDEFLILSDFTKNNASWDKKGTYCRDCSNAYLRTLSKTPKYKEQRKQYRMKPKFRKRVAAYRRKKYANDPKWRVAALIRGRLNMALKAQHVEKSTATWDLCGCDLTTLKEHIEKQFRDGMSWNDRGKWHIDHMVACTTFNLQNIEDQKKCFHYTNLRPEWAEQNLSDGGRRKWNMEWDGKKWIVHGRL